MMPKLSLIFTPQPEGGFTVTSPAIPELITEGDTLEEARANVADALSAVLELYADRDAIEWDGQFEADVAAGRLDLRGNDALTEVRQGLNTDL